MSVAEVIVIGAGIVGAACAHALAACGLSVQVLDVRQGGATDPAVENPILARMLRRELANAPGLANLAIIRTWTGFRAATPDSLPIIGPHPHHDGQWLAVGHEGLGVTTAPATAQLIAAYITGTPPPIDPAPYAPDRFNLRP